MASARDFQPVLLDRRTPPTPALLAGGALVLVDKPVGPSSFTLVHLLRKLGGVKRVGHAGTLDPFASGLMLLLTGPATRCQDSVMAGDKRYQARLRLGAVSDSHDRTGVVEELDARLPERGQVEDTLDRFRGVFGQVPPMHSAVQIGGKRLYQLARKGVTVERPPREVSVHSLELLGWDPPFFDLDIRCAKGFYVRSLARDLGEALGCGALVEELRRTESGDHRVEDAWRPEELKAILRPVLADLREAADEN